MLETQGHDITHCVKSVQVRSFFWSVFPAFRLNTERHFIILFERNHFVTLSIVFSVSMQTLYGLITEKLKNI